MELYLRYLEKYEMVEGENLPIGLILCTGKNEEHVELMRLNESNIRVGDYLTILPSKKYCRRNCIERLNWLKTVLNKHKLKMNHQYKSWAKIEDNLCIRIENSSQKN